MENIQLQSPRKAAAFKPLPYLRFVFVLLTGFALTNMGIMVFAQSIQSALPPSNPFLEYVDIFPGQPINMVEARAFSCRDTNNYYASEVNCMFTPASGIFDSIETVIWERVIRKTTFTLRGNTMKIGDLALLFDAINFHAYPRKVFFFWSKLFVIVSTTTNGNHPSMRPVWSVTFTDTY